MLSSLSRTRPPLTKICEQPLSVCSKFFASTSSTRAPPGFSDSESPRWKRNAYSRSGPSKPSFTRNEQSRPAFGLRPVGKQPWDESDPRFANEDPNLELRFGEASKARAMLKAEGKLHVPKGPPPLFPSTEHSPVQPQAEFRRRTFEPPPQQTGHYGLSSEILSMSVGKESETRPRVSDGPPSSQNIRTGEPTQYLMIQGFKGLRSDLTPVIDSFTDSQLHLVPVQVEGSKLRVDALMKLNTRRDALNARRRLEEQISVLTGDNYEVQMIEKSQYISAVNHLEDQASMAEFSAPPTTLHVDSRTEYFVSANNAPNRTLWFGNIPNELLADREAIVAKFSKYGKITDVRIPDKGTGRPRGYMYIEFLRQEDAENCYQELQKSPPFLFGRALRVDYAPPQPRLKSPTIKRDAVRHSPNTVLLSRLLGGLHADPWALLDAVSPFGEIVDLRVIRPDSVARLPPASAFVDFLDPSDAQRMIEEVNGGRFHSLGTDAVAGYGSKVTAQWDVVINPPSDTLRAWGLPLRALRNEMMLREAFGDNRKLIDIRIPQRADGWPIGSAYLQFASVGAAKETLDWMLSDPKNPITFFGREIRANFISPRNSRPRFRSRSSSAGGYHAALSMGKLLAHGGPLQQTQDQRIGWAARDKQPSNGTGFSSESDIEYSR